MLIGTGVAGPDFPDVTLVGVINAITMLKLPDFRAKRAFDLLEQVAGRAGRGRKPGKVIIQSYWSTHQTGLLWLHMTDARFLMQSLREKKVPALPSRVCLILTFGAPQKRSSPRLESRWQKALHAKLDLQSRMGDFGSC